MIKTKEQLIYEEIRHLVSSNYLVPRHMTEEQLVCILFALVGHDNLVKEI